MKEYQQNNTGTYEPLNPEAKYDSTLPFLDLNNELFYHHNMHD